MLRSTLNLGILAHVDAGKTTLSERLLHAAGVIDEVGRVDAGTTQTDSLALERQRGITIRSAIVSLAIAGTAINLIDTPGHPDFIAEVDRILGVLDGAILVISAVEGVQPQTRVLMRALQRLGVPTLFFVNKVDRRGADVDRVLAEIGRRLGVIAVPMSKVSGSGTRLAAVEQNPALDAALIEALTLHGDDLTASYVEDENSVTAAHLRAELASQTMRGLVHPAFAGSAFTGAGLEPLMAGIAELLPAATGDTEAPVSGSVFKIDRGTAGEKVAYVRMFAGTMRVRDRVPPDKVTAINVFADGSWTRRDTVAAGEIGKLWGLAHLKVGDAIGLPTVVNGHHFAPPTLTAGIEPVRREDHVALLAALAQLAEQDPLISVQDGEHLAVSLYGEVQKEVIQATLAADFGIEVGFHETTTLYLERPAGTGEAAEILNAAGNPFRATIGLRVEPAEPGSGITFRLAVDYRAVPLFVYRSLPDFAAYMEQYVRETLREGLYGWPVGDCLVTMTKSNYSSPDGPPATRGPLSTSADFRKLTPMVLMRALQRAGTAVCEPMTRARIDVPATTLGTVLNALTKLSALVEGQEQSSDDVTIEALLPAAKVHLLHRRLPDLTSGDGVIEASFGGYQPVRTAPPSRRRTTADPLHREQYLAALNGHLY